MMRELQRAVHAPGAVALCRGLRAALRTVGAGTADRPAAVRRADRSALMRALRRVWRRGCKRRWAASMVGLRFRRRDIKALYLRLAEQRAGELDWRARLHASGAKSRRSWRRRRIRSSGFTRDCPL